MKNDKPSKFKENNKLEIKNADEKQNENMIYFWNCYFENSYKDFEIFDMSYIQGKEFLCFTVQNGVAIWVFLI